MSTNVNNVNNGYVMNRPWGVIAMFLSATGMGLVPLFSRMATRVDMFDPDKGLNAGNSVGAFDGNRSYEHGDHLLHHLGATHW